MKFLFRKVPAAIMIIPMFVSVIINTLFPNLVNMGSLTTALFSKSAVVPLTGAILFFAGTQLKIKEAPAAIKRGGVLLAAKFAAGYIGVMVITGIFGHGGLFGISTLAMFAAILSSNGAIYLAITGEYGDQADLGAYSMLSIKDGPFLTLLALGASGASSIPVHQLLAAVFPMIVGIILGNLYEEVQKYFKAGAHALIPLIGFSIGASLDVKLMFQAGASGILLGCIVMMISGLILISVDKLVLRRPGYAGAALSCTAGSAVATPAIVAGVVPSLQGEAVIASVQIAAAVIVTAILCPMLTAWTIRKWGAPKCDAIGQ
ncbi:2-keto-3-deoxygluconate permease [Pelosinus propionicus]|uniref:2-keto-3-deoxygluconate permease n=1 Tax=Pelosinus propionicus DSM 13327 TaxID=1123291 RepID=A0A1I4MK70_9FIRM|nr:2-keto-3-deoxygluconate permease [Pelosinus propionicus]SFM03446.1 2-keto-3-deoxygluconate permease [Pelosinus propionicus DSM 13327]